MAFDLENSHFGVWGPRSLQRAQVSSRVCKWVSDSSSLTWDSFSSAATAVGFKGGPGKYSPGLPVGKQKAAKSHARNPTQNATPN